MKQYPLKTKKAKGYDNMFATNNKINSQLYISQVRKNIRPVHGYF